MNSRPHLPSPANRTLIQNNHQRIVLTLSRRVTSQFSMNFRRLRLRENLTTEDEHACTIYLDRWLSHQSTLIICGSIYARHYSREDFTKMEQRPLILKRSLVAVSSGPVFYLEESKEARSQIHMTCDSVLEPPELSKLKIRPDVSWGEWWNYRSVQD